MVDSDGSQKDVISRLLQDRIILLGQGVDDEIANVLVAQLLYLANEDPTKDITLYINSPGGSVSAGMAIYDTVSFGLFKEEAFRPGRVGSVRSRTIPRHAGLGSDELDAPCQLGRKCRPASFPPLSHANYIRPAIENRCNTSPATCPPSASEWPLPWEPSSSAPARRARGGPSPTPA